MLRRADIPILSVAKLWQNYRVRSGLIGFSPTSDSSVSDWVRTDKSRSRPIVSVASAFSNLAPSATIGDQTKITE